jgi:MoxR-like ATPase
VFNRTKPGISHTDCGLAAWRAGIRPTVKYVGFAKEARERRNGLTVRECEAGDPRDNLGELMGRGPGNDQASNAVGAAPRRSRSAHAPVQRISVAELLSADRSGTAIGDLVRLQSGVEVEITDSDAALTLKGLARVTGASQHGLRADSIIVDFEDGSKAFVDLETLGVAFHPEDHDPEQVHGALAAALGLRAYNTDHHKLDERGNAFANQFGTFRLLMRNLNEQDPEQVQDFMRAFAGASHQAIATLSDDVSVGDPRLARLLARQTTPQPRLRTRAIARERAKRLQRKVANAFSAGHRNPYVPVFRDLTETDMETRLKDVGLTIQPDDLERSKEWPNMSKGEERMRLEAARILGVEIPRTRVDLDYDEDGRPVSIGEYVMGPQEHTLFDLIQNMVALNRRALAFEGEPGTGKDEAAREVAALLSLPFVQINFGPKTSIEDLLGGETLQPRTHTTRDGRSKTVTESAQHLGELGRALKVPSVIVIQEPEGKQDEFVRLHSILGDNVGTTEGRSFTVNSPSGDMVHKVHDDAYIIFTYNGNKGAVRFKQAFYDRVHHFTFEYPSEEEEAKRYAKVADLMLRDNPDMPRSLQRETTIDDVMPVVKLIRQARMSARDDSSDVLVTPGGRQGVMVYQDLLWAGWNISGYDRMSPDERDRASTTAAQNTVKSALSYIYPHARMDANERNALIETVLLADLSSELKAVVDKGALARTRSLGSTRARRRS